MGFKFEQFVKKVDENLICSICHEVFQDPVNCRTGHTFCRDCIQEWLKTSKKCPMDKGYLEECNLVPAYAIRGIIDNLDVYCHPQDTRGPSGERPNVTCDWARKLSLLANHKETYVTCDWAGKLSLLANHKETCSFQQVQCPNLQCNLKMQRREKEDHDNICQYKEVECDACRQGVLRFALESHREDDCPEALIACPNKCTSAHEKVNRMKRLDLNDHVTNNCAKTKVDCPFKEQGCCIQFDRQDLDLHLRENMAGHMTLLAKHCSSLAKQNSSLEQELNQIKIKVEKQETEILNRSCYVWKIKDYPSLAEKYPNGSFFRSPTFCLCGHSWYLMIYPNGDHSSQGFVSLFLCLGNKSIIPEGNVDEKLVVPSNSVQFRIAVKSQNTGIEDTSLSGDGVFTNTSKVLGWTKFMEADEIVSSRYCETEDNCFTIICIITLTL